MSRITPALQAAFDYRAKQHARDEAQVLQCSQLSCQVYLFTSGSSFIAYGYKGRARNPSFRYRFDDEEACHEYAKQWMTECLNAFEARQAARQSTPRQLQVGDVLSALWGYEQTNVDYYMVIALVGKASVEVVQIGKISQEDAWMQGSCIPDTSRRIGNPMKKRVIDGVSITVDNTRAHLKPATLIHGCRLYTPDHWTSYA